MKTEHPIGIVTSIKDQAKAGRIRVRLPEMDDDEWGEWIEPLFPPGWVLMPEPGDSVEIVLPEGEDKIEFSDEVRYRGQLLNDANPVPAEFKKNYPRRRGFKTKAGHLLIFDDTPGGEEISISHKGVLAVVLNNSGIFLGTGSASNPVALGDLLMNTLSGMLGTLKLHTHTGGTLVGGFTGPPIPLDQTAIQFYKDTVDSGDLLSDFVKTQKTKPA